MEKITTFEQIKALQKGDRITVIESGNSFGMIFIGISERDKTGVFILSHSRLSAKVVMEKDLQRPHAAYLTGVYNSEIVGKEMIRQMKVGIQQTKRIYLNEQSEF
jgi:hypothetical protein